MAGHTPGPWRYEPNAKHYWDAPFIVWRPEGPGHGIVAHCSPYGTPATKEHYDETAANAPLISAAPDLLAACKAVCDAASEIILLSDKLTNAGAAQYGVASTLKKLVMDAIAKAEGREPSQ